MKTPSLFALSCRITTVQAYAVSETLVDRMVDALLNELPAQNSRTGYAHDIEELRQFMVDWNLSLSDVMPDHLNVWRQWLGGEPVEGVKPRTRQLAPPTISRHIASCRRFFSKAYAAQMIPFNPTTELRGLPVSKESTTAGLTKAEACQLLASIETETLIGKRDKAIISLMLYTGIRRMDVIGATIGQLEQKLSHTVLSRYTKGNRAHQSKVRPNVLEEIMDWREAARVFRKEADSTPLFCRVSRRARCQYSDGLGTYDIRGGGQRALSEKAIWKIVRRRVRAAGIVANITPHSTRHTFITLALDGGAPLHKVQAAAGHADPRTTERYWRTKNNLEDNATDYIDLTDTE